MSEPIAYVNGEWIPQSQALMPLYDTGFVQGVTIAEQLRTFRGQLFRVEQHLERLEHSLAILGLNIGVSRDKLDEMARRIAGHNYSLLSPEQDLGLAILVTPGPYAAFAPKSAPHQPTLILHTYPLVFRLFADKFTSGQALVTTSVRQVPTTCWPSELKCRSRMHYYLADKQAYAIQPGARALMLDQEGFVTEASTANVVIYRGADGLVSPPKEKILPGISAAVLEEIARRLVVPFKYRDMPLDEVASADEMFLTSTSPCILPVVQLNQKPIGQGAPGVMYQRLLAAWCQLVGVDIAAQARACAEGPRR